jgi:opacity protein-like surface antigen
MKKIFGVLAFSTALLGSTALSGSAAFAGQNEDLVARLNAADQENAAMRKKNAELATAAAAKPVSITDRMADFLGAYAADLPVAYKAPPPVEPGRFTVWVEGGAIWTGGDSVARDFSLTDFTTSFFGSMGSSGIPGIFDLNPKIGWEAATGFDYKFANSPWHVSGQFRYGEGGKTSGTAASAGSLDPSILAFLSTDPTFSGKCPSPGSCNFGGSETFAASYRETHWLADLALGYDIAGHGPTYVQVKGGLRIEEFVAQSSTSDRSSFFANFAPTTVGPFGTLSSITENSLRTEDTRSNFLGTGPLIGLEGSARFLGAWSFDYKGDLAVLFGTQKSVNTTVDRTTATPAIVNVLIGGGSISTSTDARFVTMLSPDIQAGVSYWFTPNVKLGLSYRIDALIAVKNQKSANADNLLLPQRYWHGPRLTLTGQF